MFVRCIGTGSNGNSYALYSDNGKILLLDLGLSKKEILRSINFKVKDISAAVVTHGHHDHDLSVEDFKRMGIPIWQPYLDGTKSQYHQFGDFYVQSFEVPHDNVPCVGYFIKANGHKILYATDFEYISQSFKKVGLNHMLIECNHMKELVENDSVNRSHVLRGHSELQTVVEFVEHNKTNALRTVLLCHLSRENADPVEMVEEVQKIAGNGVNVVVASGNLEIEISKYPF